MSVQETTLLLPPARLGRNTQVGTVLGPQVVRNDHARNHGRVFFVRPKTKKTFPGTFFFSDSVISCLHGSVGSDYSSGGSSGGSNGGSSVGSSGGRKCLGNGGFHRRVYMDKKNKRELFLLKMKKKTKKETPITWNGWSQQDHVATLTIYQSL
jgi:hypothetical protein